MSGSARRITLHLKGSSVSVYDELNEAVTGAVVVPLEVVTGPSGVSYAVPVSQVEDSPKAEGITLDAYELVKEDCAKAVAEAMALRSTTELYQSTIEDLRADKARLLAEIDRLRAEPAVRVGDSVNVSLTPDVKSDT